MAPPKNPKIDSNTPGAVSVEKIILRTQSGLVVDLKLSFINLEIYESVYSNYIEGALTIEDVKNIRAAFPLYGNEIVEIEYKTNYSENSVEKTFRVISTGIPIVKNTNKMYRLEMVSMLYDMSIGKKISRSFNNTERSEIVETIYKDLIGENSELKKTKTIFEPTEGTTSIVIPYWNHLYAINRICSQSEKNGNHDFMFFETLDSINFLSLSSLKKQSPREKYFYSQGSIRTSPDTGPNYQEEKRRLVSFTVSEKYQDKYKNLHDGMWAGEMLTFDSTTKKINKHRHSYQREFNLSTHIEKNPFIPVLVDTFSDLYQSKKVRSDNSSFLFDNLKNHNDILRNYFRRNLHVSQMGLMTINGMLYGSTSRKIGDIVTIEIPSTEPKSEKNSDSLREERYISGKYMILSMGHHISRDEYLMSVDMGRDSLPKAIPDVAEART
jgi:hypothetical protein